MAKHSLNPDVEIELLDADRWLTSSILQKSIRRGDTELAQRAALTLLMQNASSLWRRLMIIAFEDVGTGSADAIAFAIAVSTDPNWRKSHGGNERAAMMVVQALAEAPKDRSADYLICGGKDHPSLRQVRDECHRLSISQRLAGVAHPDRSLKERAVFAWFASGIEWGWERRVGPGDLSALLDTFRKLEVPETLVAATGLAAKRTREPITVMVPLIWLAANAGRPPVVIETPAPAAPAIAGVPMYALDKHTRVGRQAIACFAKENPTVRACLETYVPKRKRYEAALMAAFYADAAPVLHRLSWDQSVELENFGAENDFLVSGVPTEGWRPLLEAVKNDLDHLNEIRSRMYLHARAHAAEMPADARDGRFSFGDADVTITKNRGER